MGALKTEQLQRIIDESSRIVFFGGAGVSTESGILDFRSADGLYSQQFSDPPEQILSHDYFVRNTEEFYRFYRQKMIYPDASPNAAHRKLAELEQAGKLSAVITQNIDGLHQAAGSVCVLELHGSVKRNYCRKCHAFYGLETIIKSDGVPRCACGGVIKPDVVLYQEPLDEDVVSRAVRMIAQADTIIVGGTSLGVYPAAGLLHYFKGKNLVLINRSPTPFDRQATLLIRDSIGSVFDAVHA